MGNTPLLDWSLSALGSVTTSLAVNVHHDRRAMLDHLEARDPTEHRVHVSVEPDEALGTAGAVGHLRGWLDGRGALVVNADTWHRCDLRSFAEGWDGERVRVLTTTPLPFGPGSAVVASIVPWAYAARLRPVPSGLWEVLWSDELDGGRLDAVHANCTVVDCGTPADYLRANMTWSGGESVIGPGAVVEGTVERSVVWPGSHVAAGEHLVDAIRADGRTVLVR